MSINEKQEKNSGKKKNNELRPGAKAIGCAVLLIFCTLLSIAVLSIRIIRDNTFQILKDDIASDELLDKYFAQYSYQSNLVQQLVVNKQEMMRQDVALTASVIRRSGISDRPGGPDGVQMYGNGCIFSWDGNSASFPDGVPADLYTNGIRPQSDSGCLLSESDSGEYEPYVCAFSRIEDELYYMEWKLYSDYQSEINEKIDNTEILEYMADTSNCDFLCLVCSENDGTYTLVNATGAFASYDALEDFGLTLEDVKKAEKNGFMGAILNKQIYIGRAKTYEDYLYDTEESTYDISVEEAFAETSAETSVETSGAASEDTYAEASEETSVAASEEADGIASEEAAQKAVRESFGAESEKASLGDGYKIICVELIYAKSLITMSSGTIVIFIALMLILSIVLSVWVLSVYKAVKKGGLTEEEAAKYTPPAMRRKVIVYIIAATAFIGVSAAFSHAMGDLFNESTRMKTNLSAIINSVETGRRENELLLESRKEHYAGRAKRIAALIDENQELRNVEWLEEASETIGADYIMLFDKNGEEIMSDSEFKGLALGTDEKSATYDFRRLLRGVNSLSHEEVVDEVTGLTRDLYGVPLKYLGDSDSYGALILAVDPSERLDVDAAEVQSVLSTLSIKKHISIAADPETGDIKYSSEPDLTGGNMISMGLAEKNFKSSFLGFFNIDMSQLFGRSAADDENLYYYAVNKQTMFENVQSYAVLCMILFALIMLMLMWRLLKGYNKNVYNRYIYGEEPDEENPAAAQSAAGTTVAATAAQSAAPAVPADTHAAAGTTQLSTAAAAPDLMREDPELYIRYRKILNILGITGTPFHKAIMTMYTLVFAGILIIGTTYFSTGSAITSDNSTLWYVMQGDWDRGVNIFGLSASFILLSIAAVLIVALNIIRMILKSVLDSRGMTISSLIISICQYLIIIISIFTILGYLGVDYKAILASVGVASMAITFGAKDLVSDIFAGINLLADNTYQMGDIVEIGGYSGTVQEVGLRTTKIIGRGGNIKTLRNSNIGDVINLSVINSWYPLSLTISSNNDLKNIEDLFTAELPKIKNKYPVIISGPTYKGVDSVGGGRMTLLILTECRQENYNKVQRIVNREIRRIFKENEIEIL